MADVLTQTDTKQSMYPTSCDCPNGSGTRYCGHRASRPCWRRATDCFPITCTGGTGQCRERHDTVGHNRNSAVNAVEIG